MFDIRLATMEDLDAVMDMGEKFYNESPYSGIKPFCYEGMAKYAAQLIEDHYLLVALKNDEYVGMAAAYMSTLPINPEIFVSSEVVFWVEPEHRGTSVALRLMVALQKVVSAEEPDVQFMSSLSTSPPVVEKLYKKMGYVPTETAYMRKD